MIRAETQWGPPMLKMVMSGGQTGVDQAALAAAQKLGIPIGGWAPKGFKCERGEIPVKYREHMWEAPSPAYPHRTRLNVAEADATIIYCHNLRASPGSKLTIELCKRHNKSWFDMVAETDIFVQNEDGYQHMAALLMQFERINVAGSRESSFPGIFEASRNRLLEVFKRLIVE